MPMGSRIPAWSWVVHDWRQLGSLDCNRPTRTGSEKTPIMKTSSGFSPQIVTSLCQIAIWLCKKRMNQTFQGFSQATPIGLGTLRGPRHGAVTSATSSCGTLWPAPGSEDIWSRRWSMECTETILWIAGGWSFPALSMMAGWLRHRGSAT